MLIVFGIIAALLLGVGIAVSRKSRELQVERSTRINAPAERIFPHINDFHQWVHWSPYESLDPDMRTTHTGASAGQGAIYEWEGNARAGKGRMEIVDSTSPTRVGIDLRFEKPFRARNISEFALAANGPGTDVTWSMHGPRSFMARLMSLFIDVDRIVGRDFERGLANLKSVAEHS